MDVKCKSVSCNTLNTPLSGSCMDVAFSTSPFLYVNTEREIIKLPSTISITPIGTSIAVKIFCFFDNSIPKMYLIY